MYNALNYIFQREVMNPLDTQIGGKHYRQMKIQPAEFAMANNLNYCQCIALRYMLRYRYKNGIEDLNKSIHALELLKEIEYGQSQTIPMCPTCESIMHVISYYTRWKCLKCKGVFGVV